MINLVYNEYLFHHRNTYTIFTGKRFQIDKLAIQNLSGKRKYLISLKSAEGRFDLIINRK